MQRFGKVLVRMVWCGRVLWETHWCFTQHFLRGETANEPRCLPEIQLIQVAEDLQGDGQK